MEDLMLTCFSLAKRNNGMFKSKAQAEFITLQANKNDGFIGHVTSGYNSCPVFATFDNDGILKIVKGSKGGDTIMFERVVNGYLNSTQLKEIDRLEKLSRKIEKEYSSKKKSFDDGSYNGSGDISSYSIDLIELYNRNQKDRQQRIENIKLTIRNIKE